VGTRADFYTKTADSLVWHGSIAWDGHPESIEPDILMATDEPSFLKALDAFLTSRDDATRPEDGWPWPWEDSRTTDFAYVWNETKVGAYCFGRGPFDPLVEERDEDGDRPVMKEGKVTIFPDMTAIQNVTLGPRSGVMVFSVPRSSE
jgi:hypothetical protein